jgi:large conductance mechanosensitive channel
LERSIFKGFRDFVSRGNVVDLDAGVLIGAAFGAVVTAFVKDSLTPVIYSHRSAARLFRLLF